MARTPDAAPDTTPGIVTPRGEPVHIAPVLGRRHRVRYWVATAALVLAVAVPLFFLLAALGTRVGLFSWQTGLLTLTRGVGVPLLGLTLLAGVAALLFGVFLAPRRKRAILAGALAMAVGLLGFARIGMVAAQANRLPFIHDITTDTQDPPTFGAPIVERRARVEGVNTLDYRGKRDSRSDRLVSVLQTESYPDIRPIISEREPGDAFRRALSVAEELGWEVVASDPEVGTILATDTTTFFGFRDDISIRVRPGAGGGAVVDVRSVSRVGQSDLGANAERVRAFIEAFGR